LKQLEFSLIACTDFDRKDTWNTTSWKLKTLSRRTTDFSALGPAEGSPALVGISGSIGDLGEGDMESRGRGA
jgi:hypothetical protein